MKNKSGAKRGARMNPIIFGLLSSAISLILLCGIFAFILSGLEDPMATIGYGSLGALILSGALSAFLTAKYTGEGGCPVAIVTSLIFSAAIFLSSLIFGGVGSIGAALMNSLCYLLVGALFSYLGGKKKERRHKRS